MITIIIPRLTTAKLAQVQTLLFPQTINLASTQKVLVEMEIAFFRLFNVKVAQVKHLMQAQTMIPALAKVTAHPIILPILKQQIASLALHPLIIPFQAMKSVF